MRINLKHRNGTGSSNRNNYVRQNQKDPAMGIFGETLMDYPNNGEV
jgi:hypothetical protein